MPMSETIARLDNVVGNLTKLSDKPVSYRIIDMQTGAQVGKDYSYASRNRARSRADKLDLEYGAVRYRVQPVYSAE